MLTVLLTGQETYHGFAHMEGPVVNAVLDRTRSEYQPAIQQVRTECSETIASYRDLTRSELGPRIEEARKEFGDALSQVRSFSQTIANEGKLYCDAACHSVQMEARQEIEAAKQTLRTDLDSVRHEVDQCRQHTDAAQQSPNLNLTLIGSTIQAAY